MLGLYVYVKPGDQNIAHVTTLYNVLPAEQPECEEIMRLFVDNDADMRQTIEEEQVEGGSLHGFTIIND